MHSKANRFESMRDVPDMTGKACVRYSLCLCPHAPIQIALVTGGNSGIGYETVKVLYAKGATIYLAARSPSKGNVAITKLESEVTSEAKGKLVFLELDLSDLRSVRKAAEEFLEKEGRLDVLFNNAGVMIPPTDQLTAQGYDIQFGTNALGHYFLTELLLPALIASHTHTSQPARVIHTSSTGHTRAPKREVLFDSLTGGTKRDALIKKWGQMNAPWTLYGSSKLGNIVISDHYAHSQPSDVLISCALHPGLIQSGIQRYLFFPSLLFSALTQDPSHGPGILKFISGLAFSSAPVGAYTQLWAGTTALPEEVNGKYFMPVGIETAPGGKTADKQLAGEMLAWLKRTVEGF
ncbi:NAD(P)-binding protein [Mycena amicta]|nr:NAD(P)-binding protein [Mycena amicta]